MKSYTSGPRLSKKVDNNIHWINCYPVDGMDKPCYPLERDLSGPSCSEINHYPAESTACFVNTQGSWGGGGGGVLSKNLCRDVQHAPRNTYPIAD